MKYTPQTKQQPAMFLRFARAARKRHFILIAHGGAVPRAYDSKPSQLVEAADRAIRRYGMEPPPVLIVDGPDGRGIRLVAYSAGKTANGETVQYATARERDRPELPPLVA